MNETIVRHVVETVMRNRSDVGVYGEGAVERVMEGLDLTLPQDELIRELIGRLSIEETARV